MISLTGAAVNNFPVPDLYPTEFRDDIVHLSSVAGLGKHLC